MVTSCLKVLRVKFERKFYKRQKCILIVLVVNDFLLSFPLSGCMHVVDGIRSFSEHEMTSKKFKLKHLKLSSRVQWIIFEIFSVFFLAGSAQGSSTTIGADDVRVLKSFTANCNTAAVWKNWKNHQAVLSSIRSKNPSISCRQAGSGRQLGKQLYFIVNTFEL